MDSANQKLQELGQSSGQGAQQAGKAWGDAADKASAAGNLMTAAGAAFLAPLAGAVKGAADFEFAMDGVNAALGGIDTATMGLLADQAMDLGASSKFSATEIAGVQEELAKSGLGAQELLDGATKAVTDLAAATGEDLLPSTHLVSDAINAFGLEGKDASRVADIFTTAMNESSMGTADLQRGLNYLGPVLANQNRYLEMTEQGLNGNQEALIDASAALAVFNQRGLKGADVGVSLARMYDELTTGGEDATNALEQYGVTALDAQGNFLPLPDILDNVGKALSGLSDADRANAIKDIFGAESKDVVEQMIRAFQEGGLGDEFRDIADGMHEEGTAAKQAAIRQDNLTSAVEQLGGAVGNLGIAMGTPLLDPLKNATKGITGMVDALASAPEPVQRMVSEFAALGGGLLGFGGLAALGTGKVLELGEQFAKAGMSLPKFAAGLGLAGLAIGAGLLAYETNFMGFADFVDEKMADAGKAVETFGRVFDEAFFENKNAEMGQLAAGIAAFGTALDAAIGTDISPWTRKAAEGIDVLTDSFARGQEMGVDPWVNALQSAAEASRAMGNEDLAKQLYTGSKAWDAMRQSMNETEGEMPELNRQLSALQQGAGVLFGPEGLGAVENAEDVPTFFDNLGTQAANAQDDLTQLKNTIGSQDWSSAWDQLTAFDSTYAQPNPEWAENVRQGFVNIGDEVGRTAGDVKTFFDDLGAIKDGGGAAVWDDLFQGMDGLGAARDEMGTNLQGISDDLQGWFQDTSDMIVGRDFDWSGGPGEREATQGLVGQLGDSIGEGFAGLGDTVMEKLDSVGNPFEGVGNWLEDSWSDVSDMFTGGGGVSGGFHGPGGGGGGVIGELTTGITDGLGGLGGSVTDAVGSLDNPFEGVGNWLQDSWQDVTDFVSGGGGVSGGNHSPLAGGDGGIVQELATNLSGGLGQLGGAVEQALPDTNPFEGVGTWLTDSWSEVTDMFSGGSSASDSAMYGSGGGGGGAPGAQFQDMLGGMVSGLVGGIEQMGPAIMDALPDTNPFEGVVNQIGDWLGPLGQMLFPTTDAGAEGLEAENVFGDPAAMGSKLGADIAETFASEEFITGLEDGMKSLDLKTFDAVGGALLGQVNDGMKNAINQPMSKEAGGSGKLGGETYGQQMIRTIGEGLTTGLESVDPEVFKPVGAALGSKISDGLGAAMADAEPSQSQLAAGAAPGGGVADMMVRSLSSGLALGLINADPTLFQPVGAALGTQLSNGLFMAMQSSELSPEQAAGGMKPGSGIGEMMAGSLATGLQQGILAAPVETFTPVASALGTQLGAAMSLAEQATQAPGGVGPEGPPVGGLGAEMVTGLAAGLANGITGADPATFIPVTSALGTQLGAAMSMAAQQTQAPGGVGPAGPAVPAMGETMVTGLATGLANGITAADPALFVPVSNALGTQLGAAMSMAAQQTGGVQPGLGGVPGQQAAGGVGTDMVTGLAQGLTDSITNAPIETFTPVGTALGGKLSEALQAAVETGTAGQGQAGGGQQTAGVGAQLGESVGQMLISGVEQADFAPVGTALGTKLGETLQSVAAGETDFNVSEQVGTSVGQMLETGISEADFSSVGTSLTTQLSDQLTTAIDEVSSTISDSMSQITDAISEAVEGMGEAISSATEEVSSAVEDMSSSIEDAVSSVSDAVSEMSSSVEEAASQMQESAQSASEAAEEIGTAAEEAAEAVATAMSDMAASVAEAAGAIEAAAGQIIAALNSIAAAASAAGGAIGSALAGGFGASLGIQSPSKVFIGFGKNIVEGLAIGMAGNEKTTFKGTKSLAGQAMDGLATAIGMGSPAKKFVPHGASISDGMMKGMLQQAKGKMQSAMGQMAGAVESGMGKVKSAMSSAMERVRSQGQQEAASAGTAAATAAAEGMGSEDKAAEKAARRLWKRAYKELMKGSGAARFLGESWGREFWEGMLDSNGSIGFAQYVTQQIVGAAENAVEAALGKVKGLATQLAIVADAIETLVGDVERLESELASMDQQSAAASQQARLSGLQAELSLQRSITQELENRLKTEVSAAHQAHIRAVQTKSAAAQGDYEHKLRTAQATNTAIAESAIREKQLAAMLDAMQQMIAQATKDELALRRAAIVEELALKKAQLAQEQALQGQLEDAQHAAQLDYTQAVINGSNKRIRQLQKEMRDAAGPEQKRTLQAQIALEKQRIQTAQELATALAAQDAATNPEAIAQTNAQVQFLSEQITALGEVDVSSLLSEIVSTLEEAAGEMTSAATAMGDAATAMASGDTAAAMEETAGSMGAAGQAAGDTGEKMFDMAAKWKEVTDKMAADGYAFQAQFKAMTDKTAADAAAGGEDIGLALTEGITGKITTGGPALQQSMLAGLQGATDAAEGEAEMGAVNIADTFGASMRGQLGVELPKVHQDILAGMNRATDAAAQEAAQGGKDAMTDFGTAALGELKQGEGKITSQMKQPIADGVRDAKQIASDGGREVGNAMGDGVRLGVQDQATNIATSAAQTVRDAIAAARKAADSHSPSRKMMDLGDDMGLGLVLGLDGRRGDAEDASRRLVHIPMSPTSSGGVSGRRAFEERNGGNSIHIENLNLPDVTDPREFIAIIERLASSNGVASGRS